MAELHLLGNHKTKFWRPHHISFTLKKTIEAELYRQIDIIRHNWAINYNEWAVPIATVLKWGGNLCLCGDYKVMINQVHDVDQ